MNTADPLQRITADAAVCGGKPCVRGTRIWVSLVLDLLTSGETVENIIREYPQLAPEDVRACIAFGAEISKQRFMDIKT